MRYNQRDRVHGTGYHNLFWRYKNIRIPAVLQGVRWIKKTFAQEKKTKMIICIGNISKLPIVDGYLWEVFIPGHPVFCGDISSVFVFHPFALKFISNLWRNSNKNAVDNGTKIDGGALFLPNLVNPRNDRMLHQKAPKNLWAVSTPPS